MTNRNYYAPKPSAWTVGRVNPCGAAAARRARGGVEAAGRPRSHRTSKTSSVPSTNLSRMHVRRPGDVADQANDGLCASGRHGRPDPSRRPGAEVGHAGAPGARPAALPPYRRREGVSSALGPRGWRRSSWTWRSLSAAPWAAGAAVWRRPALLGSLRATPLARVRAGAWRRRRRGVAQARGNCAIVRNVGFRTRRPAARGEVQAAPGASVGWAQPRRPVYAPLSATWLGTPPGPPRTIAADRAARCRAEPDRKGRVGVAHATRKCAIVHNISQAWGFEPADLTDLQGLGNTP